VLSAVLCLSQIIITLEQRQEFVFDPFPAFAWINVELLAGEWIVRDIAFDLEEFEKLAQR
jgi:hypothetical protein